MSSPSYLKVLVMAGTYVRVAAYAELQGRGLSPGDQDQFDAANRAYKALYSYFVQTYVVSNLKDGHYEFPPDVRPPRKSSKRRRPVKKEAVAISSENESEDASLFELASFIGFSLEY